MSAQDDELFELATIITDSAIAMNGIWVVLGEHAAEDVLAAGYRKPRTITTREELEALEVTAVIRGKWTAEKWADEEGELWYVAGKGMRWDTEHLVHGGALPATVLYEPAA